MTDFRQPILLADEIGRRKSVICHEKSANFCRPTQSADKISQMGRVLFSPTKISRFSGKASC